MPWSAACLWRCPDEGCGLGLLATDVGRSLRHRARTEHGKEAHAEVDISKFYLQAADSSARATVGKRNKAAAAAARARALQDVKARRHTRVAWLCGSASCRATKEGPPHLVYRMFSSNCTQSTVTATELANRDCTPVFWGTKTHDLIERLRDYVNKDGAEQTAKDDLDVLVWPSDLSLSALFAKAAAPFGIVKTQLSEIAKVLARGAEREERRDYAKQEAAKGKAARRFLSAIGVAAQNTTEQEVDSMKALAAQLAGSAGP